MVVRLVELPDASARPAAMLRIADAAADGNVLIISFERNPQRLVEEAEAAGAPLDRLAVIDATGTWEVGHRSPPGLLDCLHSSPVQLERIGLMAQRLAKRHRTRHVVIDNVNRVLDYNDAGAVGQMAHYVVTHLKHPRSAHEWLWMHDPRRGDDIVAAQAFADERIQVSALVEAEDIAALRVAA